MQKPIPCEYDAARRLAAVVESSDDAILTKDLSGVITSWNRGAERIFGYEAEEVIGKSVTILIPPEREDEEPGILDRIRRGLRVDHYETVRRRKDGSLVDISLTISPLKDKDGVIVGASKIARDISDRKRAERELRESRERLANQNEDLENRVRERTQALSEALAQMEEFCYSVSHDLRSPVRAIHGYAKALLLEHGDRLNGDGRAYLQRIMRGGERMDRLIRDLLAYSRVSYADLRPASVSLDRVIREAVESPEICAARARVTVADDLGRVLAHEATLISVVGNLLDNACKFVRPGTVPEVRVWSERAGRQLRLWVADSGIGIRPEHQARLFRMFERVHPEGAYEGTGIGLAMIRRSVERMGGSVGVQSDGERGSRFWIQLPAAEGGA